MTKSRERVQERKDRQISYEAVVEDTGDFDRNGIVAECGNRDSEPKITFGNSQFCRLRTYGICAGYSAVSGSVSDTLTQSINMLTGKSDKFDLSNYGVYLIVALISSLILEIINIFLANGTLNMILCILVLAIFTIYVAYDVQKIIRRGYDSEQLAIYGAFDLYLDFINIFLRLLQLFGNRRD